MLAIARSVTACADGEEPSEAARLIKVANSSWSYGESEGEGTITTMGTLQNTSAAYVREVIVEVTYFDATGGLIDAVTQRLYGLSIPPAEQMVFRVRDTADKPKRAYASSKVRIISAEGYRGEPTSWQQKAPAVAMDLLSTWSPMLFMIGVWLFAMRKYGKASSQTRTVALIEDQNAMLAHQLAALERLATAAERAQASE